VLISCKQLRYVGEEKGWGVLAGEPVAAGAFIVQYTGEVIIKEVRRANISKQCLQTDAKDAAFEVLLIIFCRRCLSFL